MESSDGVRLEDAETQRRGKGTPRPDPPEQALLFFILSLFYFIDSWCHLDCNGSCRREI